MNITKEKAAAPKIPSEPKMTPPVGPMVEVPLGWWLNPLNAAIKMLVRPATANRRRKELMIKMKMPRAVFEKLMEPLTEEDVSALKRDAEGHLKPTRTTPALKYYSYKIDRGTVSNKLFSLDALDPSPRKLKAASKLISAGEEEGQSAKCVGLVHDDFPESVELVGRHRLGEEVGDIVRRAHERHLDLHRFHHVADEEVAALDVLHPVMMLRVIGHVARGLAVGGQDGRAGRRRVDAADELAQVDHVLRGLGQGDDLGLARRQRDGLLLP